MRVLAAAVEAEPGRAALAAHSGAVILQADGKDRRAEGEHTEVELAEGLAARAAAATRRRVGLMSIRSVREGKAALAEMAEALEVMRPLALAAAAGALLR